MGELSIFVLNRIKEIARISSPVNWRHVPGRMNPAYGLSRGCSSRHLLKTWWGGWWERLVRVLKDLLKRTLGNDVLTFEVLLTVLCDCESIVNSHHLTYVSEDSDDLIPLTPAMSMMSNASLDVADLDLRDFVRFQKMDKFRARLLKDLRGRFRKEYLGLLVQKAHKTT
ncbi:DUF5641 domain-containing protein [Trichonephila clavipes]|nr:DUF5641 domain-containing protein [Trichonephila clavipes]